MSSAKRTLLMVAALLPTVMVVLAAWLVGVSAGLVFAAISAACISLAVTYIATIGPRRHQDALDQINDSLVKNLEDEAHLVTPWDGADPPPWTMTALTVELCRRLAERRKQLKKTMLDVTNALASLTHPLNPPANLPPPPCPDPDDGRTLSSTYHIHVKNFQILRTRDLAMTALLKDMPIALIATDLELKIHYVNPVAEQLFGMQAARLQQLTLTKLFSDPPVALLNQDVSLPHGLGPKAFYQRLVDHKTKDLTVWIRNSHGELIPTTAIVKLGQHHVFQFLPLTDPLKEPAPSMPHATNKQLAAI
jgi:PAS domain S-box-containing protein